MMQVPSLTLPQLEQRTDQLLAEYTESITEISTTIPVSEIAEDYLGLRVRFEDLHAYCKIPRRGDSSAILGAIEFDRQRILIDQSLDPGLHPHRIGRYRYSVGHEVGHWQLHRSTWLKYKARTGISSIVCREPGLAKKPRIEQQADEFASFLLLPRDRVLKAWGDAPPFVFDIRESGSRELQSLWTSLKPDEATARAMFARECEKRFDQFAEPLAWFFQVSNQAMRIRLEGMGLLRRARASSNSI